MTKDRRTKGAFRLLAAIVISQLWLGWRTEAQPKDVIQFGPTEYSVLENSNRVSVRLVRTGALLDFAQVRVETVAETATAGLDFLKVAEDITFSPGESNRVLEVEMLNDVEVEGFERFRVVLVSTDPFCCVLGPNAQAWVTIVDNDRGVEFASSYYLVTEDAGELHITVERISDQANEPGSVWFDIVDRSATYGVDYFIASNEVMFEAGQTQAVIVVQLLNDRVPENREEFMLVLKSEADPFCCLLGENKQTQIWIDDNDRGVGFSTYRYDVNEASPQLAITLERGGDVIAEEGWVTWAMEELSARLNEDFVMPERSLLFRAGESNLTFFVSIVNDAEREDMEAFNLFLVSSPTNLPLGDQQFASVAIADNDTGVEFVRAELGGKEDGGPLAIELQRLGEPTGAFTVELVTSGTAQRGLDFQLLTNRLFFAQGQTNLLFPVQILDDPFVDGDKTLTLTLSNATAEVPLGTNISCSILIEENEHPVDLLDSTFRSSLGNVTAAVWQPDGKIVVATPLRRLNANGSSDDSFALFAPSGDFSILALQPDGKIVGAGPVYFSWLGTDYHKMARFNTNGTLDATFVPALNGDGFVRCVQLLPDGKFLVGGALFRPDGFRAGLVRLSSSGAWERDFLPDIQEADVCAMARQADGKIVIGGTFSTVQGSPRPGLARLTREGALDPTFNAHFALGSAVTSLALLGNGDVLVWVSEPVGRSALARCQAVTGLRDPSFHAGFDQNSSVSAMLVPPDGRIFLLGNFIGPPPNQAAKIVRITASGNATSFRSTVGQDFLMWAPPHLLTVDHGRLIRVISEMPEFSLAFSWPGKFYAEESSGTAVVRVERGGSSASALSVGFTAAGPSVDKGELSPIRGTVSFQPLEVRKELIFQLSNDCRSEPTERIEIRFTNTPPGGVVAAPTQASLQIVDDDAPGSLDDFSPAIGLSPEPSQPALGIDNALPGLGVAMALQPDGKVVLAYEGFITRVNADGTPDDSFIAGARLCATTMPFLNLVGCGVNAIVLEPDGHILAGGYGRIMRLQPNGVVDSNFVATALVYRGHGTFTPGMIASLTLQPDGKILAMGSFSSLNGACCGIVRLNPDSTPDLTFSPARPFGTANRVTMLPDGKILAASGMSLLRLDTNGNWDQTFPVVSFNGVLSDLRLLPNGNILLAGGFTTIAGQPRQGLARLTGAGQLDLDFDPQLSPAPTDGENVTVQAVALVDDGMLVAVESATAAETNVHIVQVAADGDLEPLFNSGQPYSGAIRQLIVQPDGKTLVSGLFDAVGLAARPGIARLLGNRPTTVCQPPARAGGPFRIYTSSEPQSRYVLQTSTDLLSWSNLVTNIATDCTLEFQDGRPSASARFYRVQKLKP